MKDQTKKDKFWWIHPKFKAKQSLTFSDVDMIDNKSYDTVKSYKNLKDEDRESTFPVGGGKYKDFAKILYKMNNYKTGTVAGWFVVICTEENKKWAVAQLKADPIRPLLVFEDLIFNNETRTYILKKDDKHVSTAKSLPVETKKCKQKTSKNHKIEK